MNNNKLLVISSILIIFAIQAMEKKAGHLVFIRQISPDKMYTIQVSDADTGTSLKNKIAQQTAIPACEQILTCIGKSVANTDILANKFKISQSPTFLLKRLAIGEKAADIKITEAKQNQDRTFNPGDLVIVQLSSGRVYAKVAAQAAQTDHEFITLEIGPGSEDKKAVLVTDIIGKLS